ncbi:hypothetical protein L1887_52064 [Cichorium endivia]|nr:hypothetical protein L1887_52064 [Cichorium endivia]
MRGRHPVAEVRRLGACFPGLERARKKNKGARRPCRGMWWCRSSADGAPMQHAFGTDGRTDGRTDGAAATPDSRPSPPLSRPSAARVAKKRCQNERRNEEEKRGKIGSCAAARLLRAASREPPSEEIERVSKQKE